MNHRGKSFFEDTLIILVVCGILYGLYSLIFSAEKTISLPENQTIVEEKSIKKEEIVENKIEKDKISNENTEKNTDKIEVVQEEIVENIKEVTIINTQDTVESFYKAIEQKIYSNISKNIKRTNINRFNPVEIRITILKNGKSEQLTFIKGDSNHFNSIKSSILEVFPLEINSSIKQNFPRYFRMKVKY